MKALRNISLLILLSVGITMAQTTITGQKKVNTDLSKYKTFGWLDSHKASNRLIEYTTYQLAPDPSTQDRASKRAATREQRNYTQQVIYSYSYIIPSIDTAINHTLTSAVNHELEGRGYRMNDANPDLLVAYKIFDKSSSVKGTENEPVEIAPGKETISPEDTITYELKPGTVFVSLIDAKTSEVVWEGFASGVADNNDVINDPIKVREAVNLIFKKYSYRGDKN